MAAMKPSAPPSPTSAPPAWTPRHFFAASALLLLAFGLLVHPMGDPDVFIHLRDGRYLVEHGFQVDREPFSYTAADQPFERAEWLFRASLYLAWRLGGFTLLILLKALAMTAALGLLGAVAYRRWPNLTGVAVLLALATLAPMTPLFPVRPYVFTYLFLPLTLLWLDQAREQGEPRLRRLFWIPVLIVPWANLHPGFMVVFGFLGAHFLEALLALGRRPGAAARRRVFILGGVLLAGAAAGCLTPMGPALYPFTVNVLLTSDYMRFLTEWAPPTPAGEPVFFGLLAFTGVVLLSRWRHLRLSDWLPLIAVTAMALKSYRNIPLFLIAALPPLAEHTGAWWRTWTARRRPWRRTPELLGAIALTLLGAATVFGGAFRTGVIPRFYPTAGLRWLEAQEVQGRVLTHDIWGGFTGWATHGRVKVFIDGRFPTFGAALYRDYRRIIWGDAETCLPLLEAYRIEALLVSPKNEMRLFRRLAAAEDWRLVYWDDVCLLYVRADGPNRELAATRGYRHVNPKHTPYFDPDHPREALKELRRAAREAPESFLPPYFIGNLLLRFGETQPARRALERVLDLAPNHSAANLDLGVLALRQGDVVEAEARFRRLLSRPGETRLTGLAAHYLAGVMAGRPGRREEALRLARRARRLLPDWRPVAERARRLESAAP